LCTRPERFQKQKKNKKVAKITKDAKKQHPQIPGSIKILPMPQKGNSSVEMVKQKVEKPKEASASKATEKTKEKGKPSKFSVEKDMNPIQDKSVEKTSNTIQDKDPKLRAIESPTISASVSTQGKNEAQTQVTKVLELSSEIHFPPLSPEKVSPKQNRQKPSSSDTLQPVSKEGTKKSRSSSRIAQKGSSEISERLDVIEEEEKEDFKNNLDTGYPESNSSA
jgi:hypothetical protein